MHHPGSKSKAAAANSTKCRGSLNTAWVRNADSEFLSRSWSGEAVVYCPLTGDTHFLDIVSASVLMHVGDKPASAAAVAACLLADLEADSEPDALAAVQAALAKLHQMGLIRPADV